MEHGSIAAIDHAADAAVVANRGSITALDHAADAAAVANRGSITAIDHAAATPSAARQWYSAEHGSVAAIDHAAATAGSPADVSAEHGSITALDHEAEDDDYDRELADRGLPRDASSAATPVASGCGGCSAPGSVRSARAGSV